VPPDDLTTTEGANLLAIPARQILRRKIRGVTKGLAF